MTFKVNQTTGEVTWVYISTTREIFEDEQLFPDTVVWDWALDTVGKSEAAAEACEARLKQYGLTKDLWPIDPKVIGDSYEGIYLLQCPGPILKVIFNNLWPAVLGLEKEYPDGRYPMFLEEVMLEMAKVVDVVERDNTRASTIKVTTELLRAKNYYTKIYGKD